MLDFFGQLAAWHVLPCRHADAVNILGQPDDYVNHIGDALLLSIFSPSNDRTKTFEDWDEEIYRLRARLAP